jgi:PadR family transcriptional regulator
MVASRDFLGEFEQIVLLALIRLGENAYGVPVRREIEEKTNRSVSVGALYSTLDRLEEKGFITSRFSDARPERGGRSRRYFKVQASGVRALERTRVALASMWEGLDLSNV